MSIDHMIIIAIKVLLQLACVRGLAVSRETAAHVVERQVGQEGYDGLLQQGEDRRKPRAEVLVEPPPEDAPCRAWHSYWPYCRGSCTPARPGDGSAALFGGLWDDCHERAILLAPAGLPATSDRRAGTADKTALDGALERLGMLAQTGGAVSEWLRRQQNQEVATAQRRAAPVRSLCAPGHAGEEGSFKCHECGASFATAATLKKHAAQHRRDRDAGEAAEAAPVGNWRSTPLALEAQEWGWESRGPAARAGDEAWAWSDDGEDDDPGGRKAPTVSLAAFVKPAARKPAKARGGAQAEAACPVCGKGFPIAEMDSHVDVCLSSGPAAASCGAGDDFPEDICMPEDLLEVFLEMDLAPEAASEFWRRYESMVQDARRPPRDAFSTALEAALSLPQEAGLASGSAAAGRPSGAQRDLKGEDTGEDTGEADEEWHAVPAARQRRPPQNAKEARAGAASTAARESWQRRLQEPSAGPPGRWRKERESLGQPAGSGQDDLGERRRPAEEGKEAEPYRFAAWLSDAEAARQVAAWLQGALTPALGSGAAEGVAVGVEVVLANAADDPDAAANARMLLGMELEDVSGNARVIAALATFDKCLARWDVSSR